MQVDPVVRGELPVRELGGLRLTHEDHAAVEKALHCGRSRVLGRVELPEGTVSAARVESLDVVDVFDGETLSCEGLGGCWSEVEARWDADRLGCCSGNTSGEDLETAFCVGDRTVEEGLLLVVV